MKWSFRKDIQNQPINSISSKTFQDAENTLNSYESAKLQIETLIEKLEEETEKRYMNDLETGRYNTLLEILDILNGE